MDRHLSRHIEFGIWNARTVNQQDATHPSYFQYASYKDKVRAEGHAYAGRWRIHYLSADGETTIRTVVISRFLPKYESGHILGLCQLRGEERAFHLGRIQRAYDLNTCERIYDPLKYITRLQLAAGRLAYDKSLEELLTAGRQLIETFKKNREPQPLVKKPRKSRAKRA